jgi:hypothetical protein
MTTTHFAAEDLMAWVDGEFAEAEAEGVEAHVAECAECAAVAARFRGMSEELGAWRVEEVPERVEAAVIERAGRGRTPLVTIRPSRMGHPRMWRVMRWGLGIGGAAVATLLLVTAPNWNARHSYAVQEQRTVAQSRQFDRLELANKPQPTPAEPAQASDEKSRAQFSGNLKTDRFSGGGLERLGEPASPAMPMIARAVSLTVRVRDVEAARPAVEAVLARHRGYAAQMNANSAEGSAHGFTASLRIPAAELGAALKELRGLGRVDNESQSGEEVTQQHQDLVARLKNARETEARMQAILEQRTGRISDVLDVEQEIARVRGEIENMEAEQAGLEHRVDFASVDLTLVEEYKAQFTAPDSAGTRARNAFVAGLRSAWETVLGLVLFCEEVGPAMVVWGLVLAVPVFFVWRRYRRMLAVGSR